MRSSSEAPCNDSIYKLGDNFLMMAKEFFFLDPFCSEMSFLLLMTCGMRALLRYICKN